MKIYTKTGDKGTTMLFGGGRVPKHHIRIEAYGTVDELNSHIGLIRDHLEETDIQDLLKNIQDCLFDLGAVLAIDPEKGKMPSTSLDETDLTPLEEAIDLMQEQLPVLKNFILPGGHPTASFCHVARCVCRRAERRVSHLSEAAPETVPGILLQYLNRLSDFLFVLSRKIVYNEQADEIIWTAKKER